MDVDETMMKTPDFQLAEALPGTTWSATGYDVPWNGWATPVVDHSTLERLVDGLGEEAQWDGGVCYLDGSELAPDREGHYHLRGLGWTFTTA